MTTTYDGPAVRHRPASPALAPMALARIGGLPVECLAGLRNDAGAEWARSVVMLERCVAALAESVSDALHPLIGDNEDRDQRRFLINLRRRVFKGQDLADPAADIARLHDLHPGIGRLLEQWLLAYRTLTARRAAGAEVVTPDVARSRVELQRLVDRPELRAGLLVASPPLSAQLDRFISTAPEKVDKNRRRFERSVLSYVGRTVVKPSPFGTFTPVQVATLGHAGAGTSGFPVDERSRSRVRLNVAILNRICRLILENPDKRADLPVVATEGWAREDDRIRYVRRWIEGGDEQQAVTFDAVTDKLFFLRNSEALDELLDLLGGTEQAPALGAVADWLALRHGAEVEESEAYLAALLRVGLLEVPGLHTPVHAEDPVTALAEVLRNLVTRGPGGSSRSVDWAARAGEQLTAVQRRLADYPSASIAERSTILAEVRAAIAEIFAELGGGTAVPQTLVYEDAVAGDDPIALDADSWEREVLEPLRSVQPVLRTWDVTLAQRLTFTAYFVARFGEGGRADDLLELLHDFMEDFFEQYQTMAGQRKDFGADGSYEPEINWLGSAAVSHLDQARLTLVQAMRDAYAGHESDEEVVLPAEAVDRVAAHIDQVPGGDEPCSHLVQLAPRPGRTPRIVLNQAYGGLHFPFSRFAYAFDGESHSLDLAGRLRERAGRATPESVVHAEITGGPVTSNLNLHQPLTDYEIVCPGEQSTVPSERRILLEDLFAVHLPAEDRVALRSRRLGVEVVPTYLGYLIPLALPEIPRSMLLFAQTAMSQFDPWGGLPEAPVDDGVGYRPRVTCGDVVLRRRCWAVGVADVPPACQHPADDAERLLCWQRWRLRHSLPEQVFVRVQVASGFRGAGSSKPMYVDFASALSLQALEGALEPEALLLITEMLPDLDAAPGDSGAGRHVVELAIEHRPSDHRPGQAVAPDPDRTDRDESADREERTRS